MSDLNSVGRSSQRWTVNWDQNWVEEVICKMWSEIKKIALNKHVG